YLFPSTTLFRSSARFQASSQPWMTASGVSSMCSPLLWDPTPRVRSESQFCNHRRVLPLGPVGSADVVSMMRPQHTAQYVILQRGRCSTIDDAGESSSADCVTDAAPEPGERERVARGRERLSRVVGAESPAWSGPITAHPL